MALSNIQSRFKNQGTNYEVDIDLGEVVAELDARIGLVAEIVKQAAYDSAPVDTGLLRSTIRTEKNEEGSYDVAVGGINGCDYAAITELRQGTSCSNWFSNAVERSKSKISKIWFRK